MHRILGRRVVGVQRALAATAAAGMAGAMAVASPLAGAADVPGHAAPAGTQLTAPDTEHLYRQALQALAGNDLPQAEALLLQLMQAEPGHAGALLDLAVLYCHLRQGDRARALWDQLEARFDPPPGIRSLIALLRERGCAGAEAAPRGPGGEWQVGRGHSSNVNQGVRDLNVGLGGPAGVLALQLLPEYAPRADGFVDTMAVLRWPLAVDGRQATAQAQWRRFDREHRFDVLDLAVGVAQDWRGGGWQGRWQAGGGLALLGGQEYQRHLQARWAAAPPWQPGGDTAWTLSATASRLAYPTLQGFDAWQWDMRAQWVFRSGATVRTAHVGWMGDHGSARRPGGDRQGWTAGLEWQQPLLPLGGQTVMGQLSASLQHWEGRRAYAPGLIETVRVQRTAQVGAALIWPRAGGQAWVLEARQVRNDESIALFSYDARTVMLSWQRQWGGHAR